MYLYSSQQCFLQNTISTWNSYYRRILTKVQHTISVGQTNLFLFVFRFYHISKHTISPPCGQSFQANISTKLFYASPINVFPCGSNIWFTYQIFFIFWKFSGTYHLPKGSDCTSMYFTCYPNTQVSVRMPENTPLNIRGRVVLCACLACGFPKPVWLAIVGTEYCKGNRARFLVWSNRTLKCLWLS